MSEPELSVVIPTFERPALLASCLEGFAGQEVARGRFEVVVVDDGGRQPLDGVVAAFRERLDLRLERRPHRGVAAARNVGVVLARAPLLVLFDDDQRPLPGMIGRCLDFHAAEPAEDAFRLMRVVPEPGVPRDACSIAMFEGRGVFGFPQPGENWSHFGFWGGAISCKASLFRYGLFDAAYGMVEDVELGLRIGQWLPLRCLFDGAADIAQLRTLGVRDIARRWLRLSWFHLVWQRNYPGRVTIGERPSYREAARFIGDAATLAERVGALEEQARALGPIDAAGLTPERRACLEDFLVGMRSLVQASQAHGWTAARNDEPLEATLTRLLP